MEAEMPLIGYQNQMELIESLDQAFSSLSHELGNSVNSLNVTLEVLLRNSDRFDEKKKKEFLQRALEQTARQRRFLTALKSYYKDETGESELFPFVPFWREVLMGISSRTSGGSVDIRQESPLEPFWVVGSRTGLRAAVGHLLDNALDAVSGQEDAHVHIEVIKPVYGRGPSYTTILVRDNGPGIPEEHLGRIYAPLFSTKEGRVGLGLSIARKALAKMNGRVDVENRSGGGAEARILIRSFYDPTDFYEKRGGPCWI